MHPNLFYKRSRSIWEVRIAQYETECELKCLNEELESRVEERTLLAAESEARLKRLAANVPGMLYQYQIDRNGDVRFSYVSDGCHDLFGVQPCLLWVKW